MSHQGSLENAMGEPNTESLELIQEEKTPTNSTDNLDDRRTKPWWYPDGCCKGCKCVHFGNPPLPVEEVERLLKQKEEELTAQFEKRLHHELETLKGRAEFVLHNEQVRASYMLREAYRERQEKIGALQTQLACKNLAGLMYVMCTERKRSKMEKLKIVEEYTSYILALQDILAEAQSLILNLSVGYKTATRVDNEWREKMKKTLLEFQMFIQDFAKGAPECNQYFLDLPKLLSTETPLMDNIADYPCNCECDDDEILVEKDKVKKQWFERLEGDKRPFVIFGDMADFKPPERRQALKSVKKVQSIPKKWKEYVFHNMFVSADCCNADAIKDEYAARAPSQWDYTMPPASMEAFSRHSTQVNSPNGRRATAVSIDIRGGMGSIIKMITSATNNKQSSNKPSLLGARDSMEIASTTKLREKHRHSEINKVVLNVGARRTSFYPTEDDDDDDNEEKPTAQNKEMDTLEESIGESSASMLGSIHHDSLTMVNTHRPDQDHKIHHEKVCPMEKCQRLHVDSFIRSLPSYMRDSPFHHIERTLDGYEACSPEQLEIVRQRIDEKKKREKTEEKQECPLEEWNVKPDGVAVQTSDLSISMAPCSCRAGPSPTPVESTGRIYNVSDLLPMKQVLNQINKACFYDNDIDFNRFSVIGEEMTCTLHNQSQRDHQAKTTRLLEVTRILKQHPSLLDIFQANAV